MILSNLQPQIQETIQQVAANLPEDQPIFLIGGAVRDALAGRPTHDLDFVLSRRAIPAGRQVAYALHAGFYPLDIERDTGRVIVQKSETERLVIDFAALRGPDLESDLRARDFTINAMALDIHNPDTLIDPTSGLNDLLQKRLRACSPDSFINDPIRILRAARFAVDFNLRISTDTLKIIRAAIPGINDVTMERVRDELFRIIQGPSPWNAVRLLDAFGALPLVLPELAMLKGLLQPPPHTLDAFEHSLQTMRMLHILTNILGSRHEPEEGANLTTGLVALRLGRFRNQFINHLAQNFQQERSHFALLSFAALYHDTGKRVDQQQDATGQLRFYGHEKTSERLVRERTAILHLSSAEINRIGTIVKGHMRPLWLSKFNSKISRRSIYRFFRDTGPSGVDICLLSLADVMATYRASLPQDLWLQHINVVRTLLEAYWEMNDKIIAPTVLLNGDEIMELFLLKPGPIIGRLLESLREAQAAEEIKTRADAIIFIEKRISQG
jgi:tRNA nucleotidyltransferase/poly(A) polymerase